MRISELGQVGLGQIPSVPVTPQMVNMIQPLSVEERAQITSADAGPRFDLDAGVNEDLAGLGDGLFNNKWAWLFGGLLLGIGIMAFMRKRSVRQVSSIPTYRISEVD